MKTGSTLNETKRSNVVVSWTGGKDGCFACYKALSEGFEISHLLNFRNVKRNGSHEINPELLSAQSQAIGIPILQMDFTSYEQEFETVIRDLRSFNNAIDLCGEFGEFHTFVTDGPIFKNRIRIVYSEKILKDGYWFLDILRYEIEERC
jgi:diphthamide synthase (EF-2-diphthine--ammonia ligase)